MNLTYLRAVSGIIYKSVSKPATNLGPTDIILLGPQTIYGSRSIFQLRKHFVVQLVL